MTPTPQERRYSPEEMRVMADWMLGQHSMVLRDSAAMLRQAAAAEARWEQLKVELEDYANQRGDEATSTYRLGAKSMAQTAVDIMARLEGERPHE